MKQTIPVSIAIPRKELEAIDRLAEKTGQSRSNVILVGIRALAPAILIRADDAAVDT